MDLRWLAQELAAVSPYLRALAAMNDLNLGIMAGTRQSAILPEYSRGPITCSVHSCLRLPSNKHLIHG